MSINYECLTLKKTVKGIGDYYRKQIFFRLKRIDGAVLYCFTSKIIQN